MGKSREQAAKEFRKQIKEATKCLRGNVGIALINNQPCIESPLWDLNLIINEITFFEKTYKTIDMREILAAVKLLDAIHRLLNCERNCSQIIGRLMDCVGSGEPTQSILEELSNCLEIELEENLWIVIEFDERSSDKYVYYNGDKLAATPFVNDAWRGSEEEAQKLLEWMLDNYGNYFKIEKIGDKPR